MEKISVIIPVYNVEKYVADAIKSVSNQTYKNLEILVIDDESKDNSGKICDKLAKKDKRIKVIHQKNKGLSGARNTGLKHATGQYIMFLDSDDYFELDACEVLLEVIKRTESDYVTANYINTEEDGKKWKKPVFSPEKFSESEISVDEPIKSFYLMNSGVWNKIFKKSFLEDLKILFTEKIPAEDAVFTTYCFLKAKKVTYTPKIVYNYRQRYADTISTNCSKQYFLGINKAYKIIYNNFLQYDKIDFYRYYYAKSMNYILYKFIDSDKLNEEDRLVVLCEMRWFYELAKQLNIPTVLKSVQYITQAIADKDFVQALKYCKILVQLRKMLPKELKEKMSKPNPETYKEIDEDIINLELQVEKEKLLKKMKNSKIKILSIEESLNKIKQTKKSIARFGDGELALITGKNLKFQEYNKEIGDKLLKVLKDKQENCLIGIPDALLGFNNLTEESEKFWINNMNKNYSIWMKILNKKREYCNANLTRLYIRHKDRSNCAKYFDLMKSIWENRDVIVCEGEQTRLGIGNDLLIKCKSVKRILCPAEDAYEKYDEILSTLKQESKDSLIILALGPTATILAYDLAKEGYQALDLGHIDIEYEWFKMKSAEKVKISNKYTNEVTGGEEVLEYKNNEYKKQIFKIIK